MKQWKQRQHVLTFPNKILNQTIEICVSFNHCITYSGKDFCACMNNIHCHCFWSWSIWSYIHEGTERQIASSLDILAVMNWCLWSHARIPSWMHLLVWKGKLDKSDYFLCVDVLSLFLVCRHIIITEREMRPNKPVYCQVNMWVVEFWFILTLNKDVCHHYSLFIVFLLHRGGKGRRKSCEQ